MALIYHLIAGIITLFAAIQTEDGKAFVSKLRKESHRDDVDGIDRIVRWGAYLSFSVAAWIVAWPLITISWAVARTVKPEPEKIEGFNT